MASKQQTDPDPETVLERIRERGEQIRQEELQRALVRLEQQGDLTDAQREQVRQLTDRLVDRLLAVPESTLENASAESRETLRTVAGLFAPDDGADR